MTDTDSLKAALEPCPICGKAPKRNGRGGAGGVLCDGPGNGVGMLHRVQTYGADQDEADAAWNRRASTDAAPVAELLPSHEVDADGKPTEDSDPWFQLGWHKDRLERAESELATWKERAMSLRLAQPPAAEPETTGCERCQGNGEIVTDWNRYKHPLEGDKGDEAVAECPDCGGDGEIDSAPAEPVVNPAKDRVIMASVKLGKWMSAALDDPNVCGEMKADIREWFSAGEPVEGWAPAEPVGMREDQIESAAIAFAKEFYGPCFDPFLNPEAYDLAERATRNVFALLATGNGGEGRS